MPVAKPTVLPVWGGTGTTPTGGAVVTPPGGQMTSGWTAQKPPFAWMNWLFWNLYLWVNWLNDITNQVFTWVGQQTFAAAAVFQAGISAAGTSDTTGLILDPSVPALNSYRLLSQVGAEGAGTHIARHYWSRAGGLYWTWNAAWNGTNWVQDNNALSSAQLVFGGTAQTLTYAVVPSGSGTFSDATWVSGAAPQTFTLNSFQGQFKGALLGAQTATGGQFQYATGYISPAVQTVGAGSNGWTPANVRWYKDGMGIIHLEGSVSGGTSGLAAFTLPAAAFPLNAQRFSCSPGAGVTTATTITVDTAGNVIPDSAALHNLSGITFPTF